MKIFDWKYRPASWNFQETELFFVKIGMLGCNKKNVPKTFLNPSLYFAVVSSLESGKVRVCESVKQIFPLIFIVDETGFYVSDIGSYISYTFFGAEWFSA